MLNIKLLFVFSYDLYHLRIGATPFLCRNPPLRSCPMPSASPWAVHPAESLFTPCSQKYQRNLSTSRTLCKLHPFFFQSFFTFAAEKRPLEFWFFFSRLIIILFLPRSLWWFQSISWVSWSMGLNYSLGNDRNLQHCCDTPNDRRVYVALWVIEQKT